MSLSADLARATPDTRDRYVDLLRVSSLGVVVLGHWLMAVVLVGRDGAVTATNVLALVPTLQPLTWLLQVMPVFFFVGGFSHAVALGSVRRRGGAYADFVSSRVERLVRPTAVFIGVWLGLALAIEVSGHDHGVLEFATRTVAQPLWFVGVYLGVVAVAPAMLRLHRRTAGAPYAVVGALAGAAVTVDVLRFGAGVPYVGFLNVALVWLAVHQLGFLYADGTLAGRRPALGLAGGGFAAVVALTAFGPYPTSMVGLPGERVSNMSPPTVALLAHAAWLIGLVLLARGPVSRWLRRPRVWRNVIVANGVAMTAFLWHLTALFAGTALTMGLGLAQPDPATRTWWLLRPLWIVAIAVFTLALVSAFQRFDRPPSASGPAPSALRSARPLAAPAPVRAKRAQRIAASGPAPSGLRSARPPAAPRPVRAKRAQRITAGVGVALCAVGVLAFSAVGFGGLLAGRTATLVVLPVTPLLATTIFLAGAALVRLAPGSRRGATRGNAGRPIRAGRTG